MREKKMTEENHQTESSSSSTRSSPLVQAETRINTADPAVKNRDLKKEKCRSMTKVVIRRLPPSMTQNQFMEQVSPLPEHDYLYFVRADMSLGQYAFSRAYINFIDQRDIFIFREKFDNYVFLDFKGTEYPAVVEFAPFQRLPKKRASKKKDVKCGSIETDPYYMSFLESLQNSEGDSGTAQPKTEYSYQPADNTLKKVTTTPLLEYLKQRKQEKQRLKDEKREERRRRDLERRRAKDEPMISKVLKNPEMEKESNREVKDIVKDEKQTSKETKARNKRDDKGREKAGGGRERDGKLQGKQQQAFNRERCDDRNRESKHQKRNEEKRSHGKRDEKDRDVTRDQSWYENKYAKKDRKIDTKDETMETKERKFEERENAKDERGYEGKYTKKDRKIDTKDETMETKERKFEERENAKDERGYEGKYTKKDRKHEYKDEVFESRERKIEEKRGKSYEKMRLEKKKLAESKKGGGSGGGGDASSKGHSSKFTTVKREERENFNKREKFFDSSQISVNPIITDGTSPDESSIINSNSRANDVADNETSRSRLELDLAGETSTRMVKEASCLQDFSGDGIAARSKFHESGSIDDDDRDCSLTKEHGKIVLRRSSLESGAEGGGGDGSRLRRHKSLDGGERDNLRKIDNHYKIKNKKDPRLERRIRNKDRPAMEIYRPGMGKFSKQRLEREKSMNDDRASLSQSPTPAGSSSSSAFNNTKASCKQSSGAQLRASSPSSEVRSMTFKRSASRDLP